MFILIIILAFVYLAFFGGVDHIESLGRKVLRKPLPSKPAPKVLDIADYEWGSGKDLSDLHPDFSIASLSPDYPELLASTTMAQLEKEWEKAHPTEEQRLKALLEKNSADRIALELEVENLRRYTDSDLRYRYKNAQPGTIVNLPKDITEKEFQDFVKKWTLQLAKSVKTPGTILHVPEMKVMTAVPMEARIVEVSTGYHDVDLYGVDGKKIPDWSVDRLGVHRTYDVNGAVMGTGTVMHKGGELLLDPKPWKKAIADQKADQKAELKAIKQDMDWEY